MQIRSKTLDILSYRSRYYKELQAKKILDTINQKVWIKSRYDSQLGYSYIYDLGVINGVQRYLLIGIGDNGFIKSARPTQAPLFK